VFKFRRSAKSSAQSSRNALEELRRFSTAEADPEADGDENGETRAERPTAEQLATLDQLGQTVVATITVSELSGADAAELVAELLAKVESANVRHFVFDLQNVNYMDSSCIGAMVEMLTRLQKAGGRIALVNPSQSVSYLFKLTKLDRLFPICRDVMLAISAVERAG